MKTNKGRLLVVLAVALAFMLGMPLYAQDTMATLTGTVSDSSGAVIPGAAIVVDENRTGADRSIASNSTGGYTVPMLSVGVYTVTVTKDGFAKFIANRVTLHAGEVRGLNFNLKPGAITAEIVVTASSTPVDTESASQEQTITGKQINELQLSTRNYEGLVALAPGVASSLPDEPGFGINSGLVAISVNGVRTFSNNWTVDGADTNDAGGNQTINNVPSIDALEEFTLARSNYDAQYGRNGGGQINVVTKGGTNQFHGNAYEFVRNNAFNSINYFANANAPYKYNDFGFTVGGPVRKDKTFFFVSEEWRITKQPTVFEALVANPQVLQGNFQYGTTGAQDLAILNPNNAPAGCITKGTDGNYDQISMTPGCESPNAKAYIAGILDKFTPTSTGPNAYSKICFDTSGNPLLNCYPYTSVVSDMNNNREDMARLDHEFLNGRIKIYGRFLQEENPADSSGGWQAGNPLPGVSSDAIIAPGRNYSVHSTQELKPTLLNEAGFNYSWGGINITGTGIMDNAKAFTGLSWNGFPFSSDPYNRIPSVGVRGTNFADQDIFPYHERNIDQNYFDNLSWQKGKHSIRVGMTAQLMTKTENNGGVYTNGYFAFKSAVGNPALANFLLGQAFSFEQANTDIIPHLNYTNTEAFFQDDWKLTRRLTLNLGARYSYFPPAHRNGNTLLDNFDPNAYSRLATPLTDVWGDFDGNADNNATDYSNGIITAGVNSPYGNAVNPTHKNSWGPRFGFAYDVFGDGKTSIRGGYGVFFDRSLNGIWEQNVFNDPPYVKLPNYYNVTSGQMYDMFDNPQAGTVSVPTYPVKLWATGDPDFKVPYYQDWNLSIEREVLRNTKVEVAFVSTKGTHLLGAEDLNQPTVAERTATSVSNCPASNTICTGYGADAVNIRPYLGWGGIMSIDPRFDSNYQSLQASVNRRVEKGLTVSASYTWSKNMTDNSNDRGTAPQDPYNLKAEYGPASFSIPQVFSVNYVYELPFFQSQHSVLAQVLGGWEMSGITRVQSGMPITIGQEDDPFNIWDWNTVNNNTMGNDGIGLDQAGIASIRPNQIGPAKGPKKLSEWFNTASFVDAIGQFGNERNGVVLGPGMQDWDMSLFKNGSIAKRVKYQFRGEFYNVFNHPSFGHVNTDVDQPNFGTVYSAHDPRIIQLGLKLTY